MGKRGHDSGRRAGASGGEGWRGREWRRWWRWGGGSQCKVTVPSDVSDFGVPLRPRDGQLQLRASRNG